MTKIKPEKKIRSKERVKSNKKIILTFSLLLLIYLFISLVICLLIYTAELPQKSVYFIILIATVFMAFSGGFATGRIHMKNGLINGLLYNLPYILLFLIISLALNGFSFDYKAVITALAMLLSSAAGGILSVNSSRKKR